jgi:hypothetical protein
MNAVAMTGIVTTAKPMTVVPMIRGTFIASTVRRFAASAAASNSHWFTQSPVAEQVRLLGIELVLGQEPLVEEVTERADFLRDINGWSRWWRYRGTGDLFPPGSDRRTVYQRS